MWLWVPRQSALDSFVLESFRVDPSLGGPVVEIAVPRSEALFNALDRAPYRRRDLSPDFKAYLIECSQWVPLPHPIAFEIQLGESLSEEKQREVIAGIRAYFAYLVGLSRSETRTQRRRMAAFVGMSFLLLSVALVLGQRIDREYPLQAFLISGFTVGGWLFLWEALSMGFIRSLDRNLQIARYERLVQAPIRFVVGEPG